VGFEFTNLVVIGTDCTGSCKFNYHTMTTMLAPMFVGGMLDVVICVHAYTDIILAINVVKFMNQNGPDFTFQQFNGRP
jgi:hypothetical protein